MSDWLQKLRGRRPFLAEKGEKSGGILPLYAGRDSHSAQTDCRAPGFTKENRRSKGETFPLVSINYYPKEPVVGEIKKREARAAAKKDAARRPNAAPRQKTGAAASAGDNRLRTGINKIRRGYPSPLRRESAPWPRGHKSRPWRGSPAPPPPRNGTACRPAPEFHHI